jgi:phosphoribosylanthranilate isomerase
MTTPEVKICGLTRVEDAVAAAEAGASFIGMVFFPGSERCVSIDRARAITDAVRRRFPEKTPKFVGVFVNQDIEDMVDVADAVGLDLIQLHGSESPNICAKTRRPFIKAFRVSDAPPDTTGYDCEWVLFDTYSPRVAGGSGETFRWELLDRWPRHGKFFLGGGITPENVAEAIQRVGPDAIDVSSGVEDAPGFKNHDRIRKLFEAVRGAHPSGQETR